ncbi:hypothetical protein C5S39_08865 [Candidatus Methanophagaceae archaeon]|nr:hypothetical protein C5S39_08865 [Methanophagales archaeon]
MRVLQDILYVGGTRVKCIPLLIFLGRKNEECDHFPFTKGGHKPYEKQKEGIVFVRGTGTPFRV